MRGSKGQGGGRSFGSELVVSLDELCPGHERRELLTPDSQECRLYGGWRNPGFGHLITVLRSGRLRAQIEP